MSKWKAGRKSPEDTVKVHVHDLLAEGYPNNRMWTKPQLVETLGCSEQAVSKAIRELTIDCVEFGRVLIAQTMVNEPWMYYYADEAIESLPQMAINLSTISSMNETVAARCEAMLTSDEIASSPEIRRAFVRLHQNAVNYMKQQEIQIEEIKVLMSA